MDGVSELFSSICKYMQKEKQEKKNRKTEKKNRK